MGIRVDIRGIIKKRSGKTLPNWIANLLESLSDGKIVLR